MNHSGNSVIGFAAVFLLYECCVIDKISPVVYNIYILTRGDFRLKGAVNVVYFYGHFMPGYNCKPHLVRCGFFDFLRRSQNGYESCRYGHYC